MTDVNSACIIVHPRGRPFRFPCVLLRVKVLCVPRAWLLPSPFLRNPQRRRARRVLDLDPAFHAPTAVRQVATFRDDRETSPINSSRIPAIRRRITLLMMAANAKQNREWQSNLHSVDRSSELCLPNDEPFRSPCALPLLSMRGQNFFLTIREPFLNDLVAADKIFPHGCRHASPTRLGIQEYVERWSEQLKGALLSKSKCDSSLADCLRLSGWCTPAFQRGPCRGLHGLASFFVGPNRHSPPNQWRTGDLRFFNGLQLHHLLRT